MIFGNADAVEPRVMPTVEASCTFRCLARGLVCEGQPNYAALSVEWRRAGVGHHAACRDAVGGGDAFDERLYGDMTAHPRNLLAYERSDAAVGRHTPLGERPAVSIDTLEP